MQLVRTVHWSFTNQNDKISIQVSKRILELHWFFAFLRDRCRKLVLSSEWIRRKLKRCATVSLAFSLAFIKSLIFDLSSHHRHLTSFSFVIISSNNNNNNINNNNNCYNNNNNIKYGSKSQPNRCQDSWKGDRNSKDHRDELPLDRKQEAEESRKDHQICTLKMGTQTTAQGLHH